MTHIAIICNADSWGGLELNVAKLAVWLKERGNEVLFLAPAQSKAFAFVQSRGVEAIAFETQMKYANLSAIWRLQSILKQRHFKNLIVAHSKDINLATLAKLFYRSLKVVYLQQMDIGIPKKDIFHTFFYKKLNAWIAPLPSIAQKTLNFTKLPASKIAIIPLCIEIEKFVKAEGKQQEAREKFAVSPKVPLVGIIGRLDPGKGQEYLLKAAKILKEEGVEIEILLVGDETAHDQRAYPQYLRKLTEELGIKVHFKPFLEQVEWAFVSLDVFVMASVAETYGMVTIEAMASGVPVVGAKVGGTADLIEENKTGLFFETENPESLAEGLKKLLGDKELQKKLTQQALQTVKEKYSHTYQCEQIEKLFASF